ncbi:hypothetical protein niasHT_021060 [Heterodera trifolii]|uniref:Major sperm protein n=1 Tax=Heterodera trifolii TaxID=157864 RepID=A0ABD2KD36_9BILA
MMIRRWILHILLTQQQQHFKQRSQRSHIKHPQSQPDNSDNNSNGATSTRGRRNNAHAEGRLQRPVRQQGHLLHAGAFGVVINPGTKRIGYAFKTTKPKRINMNPPNGVLGPKESVNVAVSCDAFDPGSEDTKGDRVTVEWTNTPDPAATAFKLEWFQGDGMVRRKNLPIEYNV